MVSWLYVELFSISVVECDLLRQAGTDRVNSNVHREWTTLSVVCIFVCEWRWCWWLAVWVLVG